MSIYYCLNRWSNDQTWYYEYILSYLLYVPIFCVLCLLFDPVRNIKRYFLKITIIPLFLEKPRDFDPFGQTGMSPLATI